MELFVAAVKHTFSLILLIDKMKTLAIDVNIRSTLQRYDNN